MNAVFVNLGSEEFRNNPTWVFILKVVGFMANSSRELRKMEISGIRYVTRHGITLYESKATRTLSLILWDSMGWHVLKKKKGLR